MFTLRPYQNEAVDSIFNYFNVKSGNPIVAMPTGTGKSLVIADFIKRALHMFPHERFMVLTHVKELIEQNSEKLYEHWPLAPIGINSASLGHRNTMQQIIFGGVGSVVANTLAFGRISLLFIDECHLLSGSDSSMYQRIIADLKIANPNLKVIGLSATPYRMRTGLLTEGEDALFTDICFNNTDMDSFNQLIKDGYLCTLIPRVPDLVEFDSSIVKMNGGEFVLKDLQSKIDVKDINLPAVREMIHYGQNRRSWMVFTSGIEHCEHVTELFQGLGVSAAAIHSKVNTHNRNQIIKSFKAGEIKCIVNPHVLTTGFDCPQIDLIGDLQPTMSVGRHIQKYGRGTRPSPETGKENCLVLDFAGNTKKLGPINDPVIPTAISRKKSDEPGEMPVKVCEYCGALANLRAKICELCNAEFPIKNKITKHASEHDIIKTNEPDIRELTVERVVHFKHVKKSNGNVSLRCTYYCGQFQYSEYIQIESRIPYARKLACEWWKERHVTEAPLSVDEALYFVSEFKLPKRISVNVAPKFPEIMSYEY